MLDFTQIPPPPMQFTRTRRPHRDIHSKPLIKASRQSNGKEIALCELAGWSENAYECEEWESAFQALNDF